MTFKTLNFLFNFELFIKLFFKLNNSLYIIDKCLVRYFSIEMTVIIYKFSLYAASG